MSFREKRSQDATATTGTASADSMTLRGEELHDRSLSTIDEEPIDGGPRGWSTVAGAGLVQFSAVGLDVSFGIYQDYYTLQFLTQSSASSISWVGSMQLFLELAVGTVGGLLMDRGYFRPTVLVGCVLFVFCCFMLSLCQPQGYYQVMLSQGVGMGTGLGLLYLPTQGLVSKHFKKRKALAMGIVTVGSSLGSIMWTILLNQLFNGPVGFAWGNRIAGFISAGCLAAAYLLMRQPRSQPTQQQPEPVPGVKEASMWAVLSDVDYLLAVIVGFGCCLGLYVPMFYIQLFGQLSGLSPELCFYSLAILNLSSCVGRIVPNFIADHVGIIEVYIPMLAINGALCFGLLGCYTVEGLVLMAIFYGFSSGAAISLFFPMLMSLDADPSHVGKRLGFAGFPIGVAQLIGPPVAAALVGSNYIWWKGMTFACVSQLVGAACLIVICIRQRRRRQAKVSSSM